MAVLCVMQGRKKAIANVGAYIKKRNQKPGALKSSRTPMPAMWSLFHVPSITPVYYSSFHFLLHYDVGSSARFKSSRFHSTGMVPITESYLPPAKKLLTVARAREICSMIFSE